MSFESAREHARGAAIRPGMLAFDLEQTSRSTSPTLPRHQPAHGGNRLNTGRPAALAENPLATKLSLAEEFQAIGDLTVPARWPKKCWPRPKSKAGELPERPDRPHERMLVSDAGLIQRQPSADAAGRRPHQGMRRMALGVSYNGRAYLGWQSQPSGNTVQDKLEGALAHSSPRRDIVAARCAPGAPMPVCTASCRWCTFDSPLQRPDPCPGCAAPTAFLPPDIAVQWARARACLAFTPAPVPQPGATPMCCCESPVRPSVDHGACGLGVSPAGPAQPCSQAAAPPAGRARLHLVPRFVLPGPHARSRRCGTSHHPHRQRRGAPTGASSSRPTPSCTT